MLSDARNAKANRKTAAVLVTALLACVLLLVFPSAAQADQSDGADGSANLTLQAGGTIYVIGTPIEDAINGIPEGDSRTIYVKAGTYSGFKINKDVDITLIPYDGNVVFNTKPISVNNGARLTLKGSADGNFVMVNEATIQVSNAYLDMRMCQVNDSASTGTGGRPDGSIGLKNGAHATINACAILGTIVVSDSVIDTMEGVNLVSNQWGKGAVSLTVKDGGRVERIVGGTILGHPNAISLQNGSIGSIERATLQVSFDDANASAILVKGPSSIDSLRGCKIYGKRAFEFAARASSSVAVPRIGAVEDSTLRCNDSSIASTADAQAKVVLDPSLVESGKAIGAGNYHDKHGEYDEWTAVAAPEGYRLSRMTRTVTASDELDPFADVGYRYFVATDCTLTFDANGGKGDMSTYNLPQGSEEVWADLPYTIPKCTFTYGTHKFKAWNTKPDGSGVPYLPGKSVFIFKTLDRKDVTLYAIYEGTLATVTFDYGGESGLLRQNVWVGEKVNQPEDPQRDHYDFGGWYTDAECTKSFDFANTPIEGNLTLYAKWENFSSHHKWVEESRDGTVNCKNGVHVTYRCTLCDQTKVGYIPPDPSAHHIEDLLNQPGQNPTCTKDGYHYDLIKKCTDCGYVSYQSKTVISKTGHSWGEWVDIEPPTGATAGVQERTCTVCNASEKRTSPPLTHSHDPKKVEAEPSTCEHQGHKEYWYCEGCSEWLLPEGDHYREIGPDDNVVLPLADHIPGYPETENVVEPTCGEDGSYDKVVKCSACNQVLSRTTEVDPATGKHTPGEVKRENETASTCSEHGSHEEVTYCTVCKQELSRTHVDDDLLPHTPGEPVRENVVDPTATEDGWYDEVVYCTVCEHELSRKEVALPAHGASYSVVEGDKVEWSSDDDGGLTQVFKRSKDDETTFDHFWA